MPAVPLAIDETRRSRGSASGEITAIRSEPVGIATDRCRLSLFLVSSFTRRQVIEIHPARRLKGGQWQIVKCLRHTYVSALVPTRASRHT